MRQLAELIRRRREQLGLTREQVVDKTPYRNRDRGRMRLAALEDRESTPDQIVVGWFANALGIRADEILAAWDADQEDTAKRLCDRLPAYECAACGRTLETTGGRRLTTSLSKRLLLKGAPLHDDGHWGTIQATRLGGDQRGLFIVTSGFGNASNVTVRAHKQAEAGQCPWFCQHCAGQACRNCGQHFPSVPGSTFLDDDGSMLYYALLPISDIRCANPDCRVGT